MSDNVFVLPTSSAQERLWFLHQLDPDSSAYNLPGAVRLRGELQVGLVERALAASVARHEVLRTRIDLVDGVPSQIVCEEAALRLEHFDLSELPELQREAELARLLAREARRPFDLTRGPLLRTTLVRLGAREHVLLWVVHHAVFDGASTGILLAEFAALYQAYQRGEGSPLAPLPLQYGDFADWERRRLESGALDEQVAYWQRELARDAVLALPCDRPRPPVQRQRGARLFFALPAELTRQLRALAQREQVSLFSVLLSGYASLLARLSGESALQIGTPVTSRARAELAPLVGCFANTVVVRAELGADPSFAGCAREVHARVQRAQERGELPFERVVEAINPVRDLSRAPLCQVFFALQPGTTATPRMPGLEASLLDLDSGAAQFDLALELCADEQALSGAIEYDSDLFERATVERIAARYRRLLESAVRGPDAKLSTLSIAGPEELSHLRDLGRARRAHQAGDSLAETILARAARAPETIAIEHEGTLLRYGELAGRVRRLAAVLTARGACAEQRLAVVLPRSPDAIVALVAALAVGAAFVPVDPSYPPERVAELLELCDAHSILVTPESAELVPRHLARRALALVWDALPVAGSASAASIHPEQAAYVIFTSGSTGKPKGVVIPQRALAAFVESAREHYQLRATDRVLQFASLSFDASIEEIFPALASGATLVLRSEEMIGAPAAFLRKAAALRITVLDLPTSFWHRVAAEADDGLELPASLRLLILGGETLQVERVQRLCEQAGERVRVVNSYGPTEATVVATVHELAMTSPERGASVPIGGPLPHAEVLVLDRALTPVPVGVTGDLYLSGAALARGYLAQSALTAAAFVPHPFPSEAGQRLYATGDRARFRADGALEFAGRADHQVKLRGFRVELGEVEARVAALPGVREVLADVRRDRSESTQLVAYISGVELTAEAIRLALREQCPEYMVPAQVLLLPELPKTRQGKIDRAALGELALPVSSREREGPRDAREAELLGLWQSALERPDISVHDNFFALGGDSILALSLVARAREAGVSFTARQLLQHQTIAELSRALGGARAVPASPVLREGSVPLTPIQRWFFEHGGPNPHHWNQSLWLRAQSALDGDRLAEAFARVTSRHDALRLRFRRAASGAWEQRLEDAVRVRFVREDVTALAPAVRERELARRAQALQGALDLGEGPLLIAALFELGEAGQRLFLVAHHLVVDAVSWRVLAEELTAAYRAEAELSAPPSFSSWALRSAASGEQWSRHERVALRADFPEARALEADTRRLIAHFDAHEARELVRRAAREGLRLEELLVAALASALEVYTGDAQVLLELEGHGRDREASGDHAESLDLSRTLGWFTSLRTLALQLPTEEGVLALAHEAARRLRSSDGRGEYGRADVAFNYLGRLDVATPTESLFALADLEVGQERDPQTPRTHALELDVALADGALRFDYGYSAARYELATIERLSALVLSFLRGFCALEQDESYALTPLQQGLLFHSAWEPEHDPYVTQVSCRLEGSLDVGAFRAAWAQVMACHEVLRTVIDGGADEPRQRIMPRAEPELMEVDLRALEADALGAELARQAAAERARGFELRSGPLTRFTLLRVRDDAWHFVWTHHHLILDGWSAALVLRDALSAYESSCRGAALTLAAPGSFRDYVSWLRRQDPRAPAEFWRASLAGFSAPTALPFERGKREPSEQRAHHSATRNLSPQASARLEEFARRQQITLSTLVQAAWAFVLARAARSDDVVFGVTSSGRSADLPAIDQIAGLFINTLPLRVAVDGAQSVGAYLCLVGARGRECGAHEHSGLGEIQALSAVPRGQPLFESLLVFENYPADARLARGLPGLTVHDVSFMEETNYALTWLITPGTRLGLRVALDASRFDASACGALLDALEGTLNAFARDAEASLGELALLGLDQGPRLAAWNATAAELDESLFVHELFAAHAARRPDDVALVFAGRELTYRELDRRANQLAHALIESGVGPDVLVAVALERSVELVVTLLAVLKAGGAYVPVDVEYPRDRVAFMLSDAAAPVLVSQWPIVSRLSLHESAAHTLCLDADRAQIDRQPCTAPARRAAPLQLAYSIYTSGSTGRPKGAGNTQRGLLNRLAWMQRQYGLRPDDRVLQKTPFSFDVSVWEFFWPLMVGARLVVAEPGEHRDAQRLCALIERERVTTVHFVPPMLEAFLETATPEACASLRRVVCSGEALPAELARRCLARLNVELHNLYGPTEAAIDVSSWQCERDEPGASTPIGRPISNTQLYVLDACGQPVPAGVAGELHIGGVGLARGYHQRPALTAERFLPDAFGRAAGARLYRTGDLVRQREDGVLEFLGRLDHQVKIRGLRVELGEIEARLLQLEGVREAVVVARQEAHGGKRLVGYVSGSDLGDTELLRTRLAEGLPAYMVPAQLVALERLPLSPNGKVDRRALPDAERAQAAYVAPRTDAERILAEVWQDVLRVPRVGVEDDFFALGGDSVISLQVVARAAQRGLSLTPKALFEHPTVASAAALAGVPVAPAAPAAPPAANAGLSADEWRDLLDELDR